MPRNQSNKLRIIGGNWRGRKLPFPDLPGLRPTPDRVRETLFNWLTSVIHGAHCLDLFSGSGALGLEALSRQAAAMTFVEQAPLAIRAIESHIDLLKPNADTQIVQQNVLSFLQSPPANHTFDLVFMDPPFHQNLAEQCCQLLEQHPWLKPNSFIYVETESGLNLNTPKNWTLHREKTAGQVSYRLYQREAL